MFESLFIKSFFLFIFSSPQEWILVIAAVFLLFGANRLPELAKSLGQTRKAFKQGLREAEEEEQAEDEQKRLASTGVKKPDIKAIDDAVLLDEIRRRQEQVKQLETSQILSAEK